MTSAPGGCDGCDDKEFIYRYDRCEVNTIYKDKYDFLSYQLNPLALETHECTGKNIRPANMVFELINKFVKVTDKDSALRARELARMEGMMVGYSSGAALQALEQIQDEFTEDDVVVLLFSDHGSKYVSKFFNDKWMREQGFMEEGEKAEVAK